jgi:toxin ParE1/3/4
MQSKRYKLSNVAQAHLQSIKSYTIENFSAVQWQKYKQNLLTGLQMLADNPGLGRSCDDVYPNGFYFPIGKHTACFG